MSDETTIVAEKRDIAKKSAKQMRRDGWIPGVVYGRTDPVHVKMERGSLRRVLRGAGSNQLIDLNVNNKVHKVLVREIQQHVTRGDLIHVDFLEVDMKSTIAAVAELVPVGKAAPAGEGVGAASMALRQVDIEARPDALVSEIEVDLSLIQTTDDVIYVGDLSVPDGVTILTDPETAVARFEFVREEEEEEIEEDLLFAPAADDVEVIGKGKDDEEEEGEEDSE
jgi:large subunit ribosomal protein L25